jgi:hypothetical protein
VADVYDIESFYFNTASLVFLRKPSALLSHRHNWVNQVFQENVAAPLYMDRTFSFAVSGGVVHAGYLNPQKSLKFTQYSMDAGFAYQFYPDLSVGVMGSVRQGRTDTDRLTGWWGSIGLMYSPNPGVSYGLNLGGLGNGLLYFFDESASTTRILRLDVLPLVLEFGSTMRFPFQTRSPVISVAISGERNFRTRKFRVKGGFEAYFYDVFWLRIGVVAGDVITQIRYGFGMALGRFQGDYGVMPKEFAGRFDEFTLKFLF